MGCSSQQSTAAQLAAKGKGAPPAAPSKPPRADAAGTRAAKRPRR